MPGDGSVLRWDLRRGEAKPVRSTLSRRSLVANGGLRLAQAAFVVGLSYAALSVYWGLGGTWLLDTVSGSLAQQARTGYVAVGVAVAVWAAAALKVIAAILPLLAVRPVHSLSKVGLTWQPRARVVVWIEAAILTLYGLVLTATGLLVQSGVITAPANADHLALAWHAYLWNPWFLLWGLLVTTALLRTRPKRRRQRARQVTRCGA